MIMHQFPGVIFHPYLASFETSDGVAATTFNNARFRVRSSILGPQEVDWTIFFRIPMKSSWLKQ